MARPHLEIVAEQAAQCGEDRRRRGGMEPVAAVVDPEAGDLERAGHAAHGRGPLEDHHLVAGRRRAPGGGEPGRARPDDRDHRGSRGWPAAAGTRWDRVGPLEPAASAALASASAARPGAGNTTAGGPS